MWDPSVSKRLWLAFATHRVRVGSKLKELGDKGSGALQSDGLTSGCLLGGCHVDECLEQVQVCARSWLEGKVNEPRVAVQPPVASEQTRFACFPRAYVTLHVRALTRYCKLQHCIRAMEIDFAMLL